MIIKFFKYTLAILILLSNPPLLWDFRRLKKIGGEWYAEEAICYMYPTHMWLVYKLAGDR